MMYNLPALYFQPELERQRSTIMIQNKAKLVTGLFKSRAAADAAVDAIIKRGYARDDISVLMSDATKSKEFAVETGTKAAEGASIGGAVGGTIGAVLAALAAIGTSIALPGLGLV